MSHREPTTTKERSKLLAERMEFRADTRQKDFTEAKFKEWSDLEAALLDQLKNHYAELKEEKNMPFKYIDLEQDEAHQTEQMKRMLAGARAQLQTHGTYHYNNQLAGPDYSFKHRSDGSYSVSAWSSMGDHGPNRFNTKVVSSHGGEIMHLQTRLDIPLLPTGENHNQAFLDLSALSKTMVAHSNVLRKNRISASELDSTMIGNIEKSDQSNPDLVNMDLPASGVHVRMHLERYPARYKYDRENNIEADLWKLENHTVLTLPDQESQEHTDLMRRYPPEIRIAITPIKGDQEDRGTSDPEVIASIQALTEELQEAFAQHSKKKEKPNTNSDVQIKGIRDWLRKRLGKNMSK